MERKDSKKIKQYKSVFEFKSVFLRKFIEYPSRKVLKMTNKKIMFWFFSAHNARFYLSCPVVKIVLSCVRKTFGTKSGCVHIQYRWMCYSFPVSLSVSRQLIFSEGVLITHRLWPWLGYLRNQDLWVSVVLRTWPWAQQTPPFFSPRILWSLGFIFLEKCGEKLGVTDRAGGGGKGVCSDRNAEEKKHTLL